MKLRPKFGCNLLLIIEQILFIQSFGPHIVRKLSKLGSTGIDWQRISQSYD